MQKQTTTTTIQNLTEVELVGICGGDGYAPTSSSENGSRQTDYKSIF